MSFRVLFWTAFGLAAGAFFAAFMWGTPVDAEGTWRFVGWTAGPMVFGALVGRERNRYLASGNLSGWINKNASTSIATALSATVVMLSVVACVVLSGNDCMIFPMPVLAVGARPTVLQDEVEPPDGASWIQGGARAFNRGAYARVIIAPTEKSGTDQGILYAGVSQNGRSYIAEEPLDVGLLYRSGKLTYVVDRSLVPSAFLQVQLEPDFIGIGILSGAFFLLVILGMQVVASRCRVKAARQRAAWEAGNKRELERLWKVGQEEKRRLKKEEEERRRLEETGKMIRMPEDNTRSASTG